MEEKECMVSILCTAYNHEPYIGQTLESFLNQKTDFPFEIVINDDASPDRTAEIIRQYEQKYPEKIKAFYQTENLYSRKINIEDTVMLPVAGGKYIAFCEGDDYWSDPYKLQKQVDFMEAHPEYTACVHETTVANYFDNSTETLLYTKRHCPETGDRDLDFKELLKGMAHAYHTSSLLFRREFGFRLPDYFYCGADYGFADFPRAIFLMLNGPVRFLDEPMSVYRVRSNQSSWSSSVDTRYDKLHAFVIGQIRVLKLVKPHVQGEKLALVEHAILEREFELLYIEGRDREQRKEPYRAILKTKPLDYRIKNLIKSFAPVVNRARRRRKGFED